MLNIAIATSAIVTPRSRERGSACPLGLRIIGGSMRPSILSRQFSLNDVAVVVIVLGGMNDPPSKPDTPVNCHWYGY
jgi:hypothetical protein